MGDKQKKETKKPTIGDLRKKDSGAGSTKGPKVKEEKGKAGEGVVFRRCSCESAFQDKHYGRGIRVFNVGGTITNPTYTCTVCGAKK